MIDPSRLEVKSLAVGNGEEVLSTLFGIFWNSISLADDPTVTIRSFLNNMLISDFWRLVLKISVFLLSDLIPILLLLTNPK